MQKLYQRLSKWARFFRSGSPAPIVSRTVHTEVTVERQGVIVMKAGVSVSDFDTCPVCGQRLPTAQEEVKRPRLQEGSRGELRE